MSGLSTPPPDQTPQGSPYVAGGNQRAEWYDVPEGSQAIEQEPATVPSADSNEVLYLNPDDPDYAFTTSPISPNNQQYVQLSGTDFTEQDGFISLPVETDL
ncbi:hypothetical protein SEA_KABOCHA_38 [Gordonia phage Kabocha]|uniref:Uncharacterized protein n=1 Tax=Gordonia phage Chidiebere TaxID=2656530 RepID=A0A649VKS0_9CAUD|nr:hypothetical protein PQD14_gp037 [Gordonia phage Chidiebere]AZS07891.1 hypothetical protein PBI_GRAY_37 [Gordonia phage Gray]WAA19825.1 hypothetical protein SEA_KABOCHA_38 [Gordonia phage Kabocha]WAA20015.1 hypothetical protein SEA_HANEM_37 [Gordonia phage Hanem]WNM67057.1 hypothetical protein SEA_SCHOMBER_36 [Gordonia Phage Schomber]QGJ92928.1 hypothetical protein PBI_CHIDIEBERE_37 [Gordonia phage Chidiebere]